MGEVTPETVNGLINAWLRISELVDAYGPVTLASAIPAAGWWISLRVHDRRQRQRRERQDGIRRLENYANHPANRIWKEDRP